ncbi:MAG: TrmB family transcriptional regulator [Chloroflexota bacterium]
MEGVVALLRQLSFTEYEARSYVALLRQSPLNGYEVARASGVPRADVYAVLQRLEARGAVLRVESEAGTRYAPLPPEELLRGLEARFQVTLRASRLGLEGVTAPPEYEYTGNARGYGTLLEHAGGMVEGARQRLRVALAPPEALALTGELAQADARGVEITTLCLHGCQRPCGHCRGHIHRFQLGPVPPTRWLVAVQDRREVLAGEIRHPNEEALSVRSRQPLLVEMAARYIDNSIALATLVAELGDHLEPLLTPESRAALASLGTGSGEGTWLEQMRDLVSQRRSPDGE